ncbi:hypothetical protein L1987_15466 [Smallanthus sonchifolius]|uniref:Uncharacterized protein n=1 Tax=Smallanthus sonchifolius TaxID=185202 RepID=A0ACB9J5J6_9ASTR|nr:hypothetical protein L1987_15466 [Smallanthus sonchifolius]
MVSESRFTSLPDFFDPSADDIFSILEGVSDEYLTLTPLDETECGGDQASIIGGVIDFISELQQVLQSLEAKKQRKVYIEVLSPRLISSPRTIPLSPRKPPLSPRPSLPISPRTPQSASPYRHRLPSYLLSPSSMTNTTPASPCNSSSNSDTINELVANSRSSVADVEVKFSGANLLLKTISPWLAGQASKIISALEDLSLEVLQATINTVDERMVNSFTIKVKPIFKAYLVF